MSTAQAKPTTNTQAAVLAFVAEHWNVCGYGPTVRDVQRRFGWRSPTGASYHLERLRKGGHIVWNAGEARSIKPTGDMT